MLGASELVDRRSASIKSRGLELAAVKKGSELAALYMYVITAMLAETQALNYWFFCKFLTTLDVGSSIASRIAGKGNVMLF